MFNEAKLAEERMSTSGVTLRRSFPQVQTRSEKLDLVSSVLCGRNPYLYPQKSTLFSLLCPGGILPYPSTRSRKFTLKNQRGIIGKRSKNAIAVPEIRE